MEENTTIKCTNHCGFSVTGSPDYCQKMYDAHEHEEADYFSWSYGDGRTHHWYQHLFSFWGVVVLMVLAGIVTTLVVGH